eukprot:TRINITY_DN555829_c0_g1_i3.p1 TRINITY_DN555829_c0_g1~~TRINITY_DN555829_c0_g1_i3.p1  ORF type:complete len:825 (-),score=304.07 TRINITY_DN555829_c0_g1_i3:180-2654(-)
MFRFFCYCLGDKATPELQTLGKTYERPISKGSNIEHPEPKEKPVSYPIKPLANDVLATGEAEFTQDMKLPDDALIAVFARNFKGIGTLKSIDISKAKAVEGVEEVLIYSDVPGSNIGGLYADEYVLTPIGRDVEYMGAPIALVVAKNMDIAQEAIALVEFTLENMRPPVTTMEEALKKKMFYRPQYLREQINIGNVTAGFADADRIVTGSVSSGLQKHFYIETQNCICIPREDDALDVYAPCQDLWTLQNYVCNNLNLKAFQVSCKSRRLGGAFGGKATRPIALSSACGLAAMKTGRAVRLSLWRQEDMDVIGSREPLRMVYKVGIKNDGTITAMQTHCFMAAGAAQDSSPGSMASCFCLVDNVYHCDNWLITQQCLKTNLAPDTAMRGPVATVIPSMTEVMMDHCSREMKMDPALFREKNFYKPGDKTTCGQPMWEHINLEKVHNGVLDMSEFTKQRQEVDEFNKKNKYIKRGLAECLMKYPMSSRGRASLATLRIFHEDGTILITHDGMEEGQGIDVKVAQVCAYELGVPMELIRVNGTSTDKIPYSSGTGGSGTSENVCVAMGMAAKSMKQRLQPFLTKYGDWSTAVAWACSYGVNMVAQGWFSPQIRQAFDYWVFGGSVSLIEINTLTGEHTILKTDILYDNGISLNPAVDEGQIEGAFVQAVGFQFNEESITDPETGKLLTNNTWDYKIPSSHDIPLELNVKLLADAPNPRGYYSSKATGEAPWLLSASVLLAAKDAIMACRADHGHPEHFDLEWPLTVEKIQTLSMADPTKFAISTVAPLKTTNGMLKSTSIGSSDINNGKSIGSPFDNFDFDSFQWN